MSKAILRSIVVASLLLFSFQAISQKYITRDIKSFGAKGDGKTNDQAAFEKAADFFNKRGGKGILVISKGAFLAGKQVFTQGKEGKPAYLGYDVLRLINVKDMTIEGKTGAKLKYLDSLRFGAFNPETGKPHPNNKYFVKYSWAAPIGSCILIENSSNVTVKSLELDGNSQNIILGGVYGDVGRQLAHYGIFIKNSKGVTVSGVKADHFALDGISVANKASDTKDDIKLLDSSFEYNGRQGFSWIGGNDLYVKRCKFNHTGKGKISSPPGAGVDIEAEVGPIQGGKFEDCEFINNTGVGMVADNGDSRDCEFKGCTFWGVSTWSLWVNKPAFTFTKCNIYGSFVHGFNAPDNKSATKFIECLFEDKSYKDKPAYGNFLIESNNRKRVTFEKCSFIANHKKLCWVAQPASWSPEEKYQFIQCNFIVKNANYPERSFIALIRGIRYKDCAFKFLHSEAKQKGYYLNACCEKFNVDLGGNQVLYSSKDGK